MLKKLSQFNPGLITQAYFPQYVKTPHLINYGRCFMWAYLARRTFSNVGLWCVDIHAFVKYQGKFYDSETLHGVEDHLLLPATRQGNYPGYVALHSHTEEDFKYQWNQQTYRFGTSWEEMDEMARKELERHANGT